MRKLKVLHCIETIGSGGVERRRLSIVKLLPADFFEVKIICTKTHGQFHEEFEALGVEVIVVGELKSIFDFAIHRKVQKVIEEFRPDIIHGAVFEGVIMAAVNGFVKKVPYIILEETSAPVNRSWKANLLLKLFSFVSDSVIAVSPATRDYLVNIAKIDKGKVRLISNGVKAPRLVSESEREALKVSLGIQDSDFVIGSVGRMLDDATKRFSDLIKAVALLVNDGVEAKLLLVGEGKELQKYKKLTKELNIESNVVFVGFQKDVAPYYSIMDVFSLVSASESFGLVLAEAMFAKLPVVATRIGGMQFIVEDKRTGMLVPSFDIQAIEEALKFFYSNPEMAKNFGEKGFERALKEYSEVEYVNKIASLYSEFYNNK